MDHKKNFAKKLHIFKLTVMAIIIILAGIFFSILALNPALRGMISVNPLLLAICTVTWICLIVSFAHLAIDFYVIKKHHDLARDLDELSFLDTLTGLPNRYSIDRFSSKYNTPEKMENLGCVLFMISNLKEINEKLGRDMGDKAISDFCEILESVGRYYGLIGRNSGNEFIVVIENSNKQSIEMFLSDFQRRISNHNTLNPAIPLMIMYSYVLSNDIYADHFYTLITGVYRRFNEHPLTLM